MNKMNHIPDILLIRPPLSIPRESTDQWNAIKSFLGAMPINLHIEDGATAFFQGFLMGDDHLSSQAEMIDAVCERFLSPQPWTYGELLRDSEIINQALAAASQAFSPCRFHRNGFAHSGLDSIEDLMQFAHDVATNPIRQFAERGWHPFKDSVSPDLALIHVERPGEMGPAMTLATVWQKRWPEIPLKLLCPESIIAEVDPPGRPSDFLSVAVIANRMQLQQTMAQLTVPNNNFEATAGNGGRFAEANNGFPLVAEQMPEVVRAALKEASPLVVWRDCGDNTADVTRQLYAASRQGIWNHLVLLEQSRDDLWQFAATNANIVHSYCTEVRQDARYSDPVLEYPSAPPGYGRTKPLPGVPLWMALKDVMLIRKLLGGYDAKTLLRLRVKDDGHRLFEVGRQLTYQFRAPAELPTGYLDEIVRMVEAGGSVNTQFVRHNLERAHLIAYAEEEGVIIGNSSLKHPRLEYIDAVSRQSGIDLQNYLERGYTSVRPEYRGLGIGAKLLDGLTQRAGDHKIFSVIAENNVATQKMAMRNRTRRVATFFSQRANKPMSVWIPEWMLPEGVELPPQPDLDSGMIGKEEKP